MSVVSMCKKAAFERILVSVLGPSSGLDPR